MVRWCVSFGYPRFLFPDGLQYCACFGVLIGSKGMTQIFLLFLFNIVDMIGSPFALLNTSLVINSFHLLFRNLSIFGHYTTNVGGIVHICKCFVIQ